MNLGELTRASVNPAMVYDALIKAFCSVETERGKGVWNFVFVCRDREGDIRLMVPYFITDEGRWIYDIEGVRSERGKDQARQVALSVPQEMPLALAA